MAKFYTPFKLSENIRETPEGYLLCLGVPIARTGWQTYGPDETPLEVGPDGTVEVYRSSEEVFRPETVASFQGKSITIRHPQDFVKPANWQALTRGTAQNVRKADEPDEDGEESLLSDLLITEMLAIQLVKNGLREVSCGYEAEYEQTGVGKGRQFNIIGNHIALVEEGRAGSSYAINDHKGKVTMSAKLIERLKAKFGAKVIDEAMAEEKKDDGEKSKDAAAYDELVKMVKDLAEKIDGMGKSKDEDKADKKDDKAAKDEDADKKDKEKSEDDDGEEMKIEERIKALEAAVAKLLDKGKAGDEEGEEEESEDEDEEEESEDDDFDDSSLTGDTAARLEILSPGMKPVKKEKPEDTQKRALVAAFGTKDGREVIETITGKKKLVLDSAEHVSTLFIAASEVLKAKRGTGLEKTKDAKAFHDTDSGVEVMTAEKMNELNAAHWGRK